MRAPRTINQARLVRCSAGCGALVWLAGALPTTGDATFVCPTCTVGAPAECEHEAAGGWSEFCAACLNRHQQELADPEHGNSGALRIVHERSRQMHVEGYTVADDVARQPGGELAIAAWCYLGDLLSAEFDDTDEDHADPPAEWPWDLKRHWKPTPGDPVRQLVKAGALIAAEIDRLIALRGHA